jgi:hypothetical protein
MQGYPVDPSIRNKGSLACLSSTILISVVRTSEEERIISYVFR